MKVLLAIDDSDCSAAATGAVIAQFRPAGAEVRVLHAIEWPSGLPPSYAYAEGRAAADEILREHDEERRLAHVLVDGASARLEAAGFHATSLVREGSARDEILHAASDWRPDVIVLGSHGRRGLDRLFSGSVSEAVVKHAQCSVEVVRPPQIVPAGPGSTDARP